MVYASAAGFCKPRMNGGDFLRKLGAHSRSAFLRPASVHSAISGANPERRLKRPLL